MMAYPLSVVSLLPDDDHVSVTDSVTDHPGWTGLSRTMRPSGQPSRGSRSEWSGILTLIVGVSAISLPFSCLRSHQVGGRGAEPTTFRFQVWAFGLAWSSGACRAPARCASALGCAHAFASRLPSRLSPTESAAGRRICFSSASWRAGGRWRRRGGHVLGFPRRSRLPGGSRLLRGPIATRRSPAGPLARAGTRRRAVASASLPVVSWTACRFAPMGEQAPCGGGLRRRCGVARDGFAENSTSCPIKALPDEHVASSRRAHLAG